MANSKVDNNFLGRGWSFPPEFNNKGGSVSLRQAEDDIKESLKVLLSTRLGERVMRPNFGCNLDDYVFEALNVTQKTIIKDLIETAILYFEPRIDLDDAYLDDTNILEGKLIIHLSYKIRATNSRGNMVFPFYINEGSEII